MRRAIVGYSFRDACVNDLLTRTWEARKNPPTILVVTHSDNLKMHSVEDAFGWKRGSAAANNLAIDRSGVFDLAASAAWAEFASAP